MPLTSGAAAISSYRSVISGHSGVPVDPKAVPGTLALWLRADLGVTLSSTKVTTWVDQSANAFSFVQAVDGNRPVYTAANTNLNSQPSLEWSATNHTVLVSASSRPIATSGIRTIFAVVRPTDVTGGVVIDFDTGNQGFAWLWQFSANTFVFTDGVAVSSTLASDPTFINTARVNTYIHKGTGVLSVFRTNKTAVTTVNTVPAEIAGSGVAIGARGNAGITVPFTGSIAEVIVFDGELPASSCVAIENYLHARYAIAA